MKAITLLLLAPALGLLGGGATAQTLHPDFELLDEEGRNVLLSGGAVSTTRSCRQCHDVEFIERHSFHASVGLGAMSEPGTVPGGRPWDTSPGLFGKWTPITNRVLSPAGSKDVDLTTPDWIRLFGARHVGGGPAVTARDGTPLALLKPIAGDPETHNVDETTGDLWPWDWPASGVVEMNCFLCHLGNPDNEARTLALRDGSFRWANTATLARTGIVTRVGDDAGSWSWNQEMFGEGGELLAEKLGLRSPTNGNCGLCHGLVKENLLEVPVLTDCDLGKWSTATRGEIVSPQRMRDSGMNLKDKLQLSRSWDVHAERLVRCVDCHFSVNHPIYRQESEQTRPEHLRFGARGLRIGQYLQRPSHELARGSRQRTGASSFRRCESCHDADTGHDWLPYRARHFQELDCEVCHIPRMQSGARRMYDWTALTAEGKPLVECRGFEGDPGRLETLISGFDPALLPRPDGNGGSSLAPFNLIASWYWIGDDPPRPVSQADLRWAYLEGERHAPEVVATFDGDGDGDLNEVELRLDRPEKVELIRKRLCSIGVVDPRIEGTIDAYDIHHGVTTGAWATRECSTCHHGSSRLGRPMFLASYLPGGVLPGLPENPRVTMVTGGFSVKDGELSYVPGYEGTGRYVLGLDRNRRANALGSILFLLALAGVALHAGLRWLASRKRPPAHDETPPTYFYGVYERLWHWLQALAIVILILTGLAVHRPEWFGLIPFDYAVSIHNVVGFILLANAALAVFYHVASGQIQQYLPEPRGFFSQAIAQTSYYLRGIFRGDEHPFEKTGERRLNPLQQLTYLTILNVLLPLQMITGLGMWGAQRWPEVSATLGGMSLLGAVHTLGAWLFAAFLGVHVYLTTTGSTPLAGIRAMLTGWEGELTNAPSPGSGTEKALVEEASEGS